MITTKVTILGIKYTVRIGVPVFKDPALVNRFGYSCPTERTIVVADMDSIEGWKDESNQSKQCVVSETLRHEIIHCFLHESGVRGSSSGADSWAMNEEMVDWIAMQFSKILKVFKQLGCEGEI